MTLYALVEDYDNGQCGCGEYYYYSNMLCGLFEDKQSALNHLLDAVPEHNVEIIKQEKTKVVVKSGETITVRRVDPVEVNTANKGIWCASILEDKEDEIYNWVS